MDKGEASIEDILNLELDYEKLIEKNPNELKTQIHTEYQATGKFDKSYVVPVVGDKHPEKDYLIGVNSLGHFNTQTLKFVSEPRTLTDKVLQDVMRLIGFLKADEIFLQDGEPIKIKLGHKKRAITLTRYSLEELHSVIGNLTSSTLPGRVISGGSEPFGLQVSWMNKGEEASLRFRGNGTRTLGMNGSSNGVIYVLRRIGDSIPTLDELSIDEKQREFLFPKRGLVLLVGETGEGKSSYLAAVIREWVTDEDGIVLSTYEFPVEFDYRPIASPNCIVGQTDLSNSLDGSYEVAAKDATRRNSDVILIGEVRDKNSAAGALNLALSGTLVYSTFHAGTPMEAMDRLINYFPVDEQPAVRNTLIGTLQAIVCVKLVPTKDDKRVQIRGYMAINREIREKLYLTDKNNFVTVVKDMYEKHGHTMSKDLETYKDRMNEDDYASYKHIFF